MSFTGKVVLITGGSSGIGADAAHHLAKLGAKVSIIGRNETRLNQVAEQIKQSGAPDALPIVADVTKDAERIINETVDHFGQIDILVNNAGIFTSDNLTAFDVDVYDRIMNTNLRSVIQLTHFAVPHLEKTKGNIINVSSYTGILPYPNHLSSCMSKVGVNHFTKCAAIGLASKRIRVNAIIPGDIRTPIFESIGVGKSNADEFFEKIKEKYLVGRIGDLSDINNAIEYLASQSFINGILLPVDGGLTCLGTHKE